MDRPPPNLVANTLPRRTAMKKLMYFLIICVTLTLYILVHEFSHAVRCYQLTGRKAPEMSLGFKLPWVPSLEIPVSSEYMPVEKVYINHIPLGAYILLPTGHEENLTDWQRMEIDSAGVAGNLFFLALMAVPMALAGRMNRSVAPFFFGIAGGSTILLIWNFRLVVYILPLLSLCILFSFIKQFMQRNGSGPQGPIGIFSIYFGRMEKSMSAIPSLMWGLQLGITCFNLLPLLPLDGGHVVSGLLKSAGLATVEKWYSMGSTFAFCVLLSFVLTSDFRTALRRKE